MDKYLPCLPQGKKALNVESFFYPTYHRGDRQVEYKASAVEDTPPRQNLDCRVMDCHAIFLRISQMKKPQTLGRKGDSLVSSIREVEGWEQSYALNNLSLRELTGDSAGNA